MSARESRSDDRRDELDRDLERYREAATATLDQLESTVDYLNSIQKPKIAKPLDRNRRQIIESMH